ncbi:uncharacterized protein LOC133293424 [Gastrolobium bilobum]|uniref:uncharacterized protein LOC133293424 n=1 Tax=Gastrolobium bilobum TaxID=150636 RepID=UPI002AB25971|nr:uncharacterized protein LOC133293424 [Gastrolobium bilobum]
MVGTSSNKRMKMAGIIDVESLVSLPSDLLLLIFGKVAYDSIEDITNIKLTCIGFLRLVETDYVYERVSLDKFAVGPLERVTNAKPFLHRVRVIGDDEDDAFFNPLQVLKRKRQVYFLQRCRECGNPEVLYREGLVNYFRETSSSEMQAVALEGIRTAALKDHQEAKYACSIILMAGVDEDQRAVGFEFFCTLDDAHILRHCRRRVRLFIRALWVRREMVYHGFPICNPRICEMRFIKDEPSSSENNEINNMLRNKICQRCKADIEVYLFCIMTII